ncbi:MAG: hypothetical protein RL033_2712 [Pseudomonadota bacterium]|jgi:hypothetical protein
MQGMTDTCIGTCDFDSSSFGTPSFRAAKAQPGSRGFILILRDSWVFSSVGPSRIASPPALSPRLLPLICRPGFPHVRSTGKRAQTCASSRDLGAGCWLGGERRRARSAASATRRYCRWRGAHALGVATKHPTRESPLPPSTDPSSPSALYSRARRLARPSSHARTPPHARTPLARQRPLGTRSRSTSPNA